jgi:Flp pilus assembly pilin Flp
MTKKKLLQLLSDESGVTAIEMALLAAFVLVPLLLGATEIGRRIWITAQIGNAAHAGIEYAIINKVPIVNGVPDPTAISNINAAVASATGLTVTATTSHFFGCPTSTGVTAQASGSTCSNGGVAGSYLSVTATASFTPLFHSCGGLLPETICPLSSTASNRSLTITSRIG